MALGIASICGIGTGIAGSAGGQPAEEGGDVPVDFTGDAIGTSSATGDALTVRTFSGDSIATSSAAGDVLTARPFSGDAAGTSSAAGDIVTNRTFSGSAAGTSAAAGNTRHLPSPVNLVVSKTAFFGYIADFGVSIATGVTQVNDLTPAGRNASQGVSGAQPVYSASDSNFGNRASISFDGSNDTIAVAWDPPAPGTTNVYFFGVIRQDTYTAGEYIWAGGNLILGLAQSAVTPELRSLNPTAATVNANLPVGTTGIVEQLFGNSTADYLRVGSAAAVTGVNAGNSDALSFSIGSRPGSGFGDSSFSCLFAFNGTPSEVAGMRAWALAYYNGISG